MKRPPVSGTPGWRRLRSIGFLLALVAVGIAPACSKGSPDSGSSLPATASPTTTAVAATPAGSVTTAPGLASTSTPRPTLGAHDLPAALRQDMDGLIARTAQVRGLAVKAPVEMKLIGRRDAVEYYRSTYKPQDLADLKLKQELYILLGLLPPGANLQDLFLNVLGAGITGFYDPDVKTLFLLEDFAPASPVTLTTAVHETTHALQDQYFDLNAITERLRDDWDASTAFLDVVEGDAVGTEKAYGSGGIRGGAGCFAIPGATSSSIPYVIVRELNSWYDDGLCFVQAVQQQLPRRSTGIFERLPRSTEQVLHPEKYLANEAPLPVTTRPLEDVLGAGWSEMGSSTFGEFELQNLLHLGLSDSATVKRGAAGWGGDRWTLYGRDDGARLVQLVTAWDSEAEAQEFWAVLLQSLAGRSNGAVSADASATEVAWEQQGKTLRASISGSGVTIVMSTDAAAVDRAAKALGFG